MKYVMTEKEIVELMNSCKGTEEWNKACVKIKKMFNGGYPPFWYKAVIEPHLSKIRTETYSVL